MKILSSSSTTLLKLDNKKRLQINIKNNNIIFLNIYTKKKNFIISNRKDINDFLQKIDYCLNNCIDMDFKYNYNTVTFKYKEVIFICNTIFNLIKEDI